MPVPYKLNYFEIETGIDATSTFIHTGDLTATKVKKYLATSNDILLGDGTTVSLSSLTTLTAFSATAPLLYNNTTGVFSIPVATAIANGYLSSTDWVTFNNKTSNLGTVTSVAALTLGTTGTDLSSTVANGTTTPIITLNVPTASAANRGALSSADWTTFNSKQAAGNYITSLTGEATASGPGASSVTLDNTAVIGKVLTGLNVTGGTVISTDSILAAFGKVQNQINGVIGGSIFQGTWNASTNNPALTSSVGTNGHYYIVSVDGSTNLNGITDWKVGDWAIFAGTTWQKVDNTDSVASVNGYTGTVSLVTGDVLEGAGSLPSRPSQLYFTDARARAAISLTTSGSSGASTYNSTTGVLNIPNYADGGVLSVSAIGSSPNANAATITGTVLNLEPASASFGGVITTGTQTFAGDKTIQSSGSGNTLSVNHSSGNGAALNITKGGNGEGLYVNKTSGSGNAATIIGTLNATTLVKSGGTSSQFLKADGTVDGTAYGTGSVTSVAALTLGTTGTDLSSTVANGTTTPVITLNVPDASATARGVVTTGTQTFAGAKTFNNGLSASNSIGNTIASTCSATGGVAFYGQSSAGIGAQFESGASGEAALIAKHTNSGPLQYWMNTSAAVATMSNAGNLTANSFVKTGGTSSQFLMADGSVNTSVLPTGAYLPLAGGTLTGGLSGTTATFSGKGAFGQSLDANFQLAVFGSFPSLFTANSNANSATYGGSIFYRNHTGIGQGNGISFNLNNASNLMAEYAYIGGLIETNTTGSENGSIVFFPSASGVRTERMRLSSSGLLTLLGSLSGTSATFKQNASSNGSMSLGSAAGITMQPYIASTSEAATSGFRVDAIKASNISGATGFSVGAHYLNTDFNATSGNLLNIANDAVTKFKVDFSGALTGTSATFNTPTLSGAVTTSINSQPVTTTHYINHRLGNGYVTGRGTTGETYISSNTDLFTATITGASSYLSQNAGILSFFNAPSVTAGSTPIFTQQFSINAAGVATFSSTITTGAPSGGTAKPFKIGNVATVSPTSPNRTIEIEIDGTTYYLTAKTTNN